MSSASPQATGPIPLLHHPGPGRGPATAMPESARSPAPRTTPSLLPQERLSPSSSVDNELARRDRLSMTSAPSIAAAS